MIIENFFVAEEREIELNTLGYEFQDLEKHVDFASLAAAINQVAPIPSREHGGCPPYPTEIIVKVLLLQQFYTLRNEHMKYQLLGRPIFQLFAALCHSCQIPDRTTLWTFLDSLTPVGAIETLFYAVKELAKHVYLASIGQLVDATILSVPKQHMNRKEKKFAKQTAMFIDWMSAQRIQKDIDAVRTNKDCESHFGKSYLSVPTSVTR